MKKNGIITDGISSNVWKGIEKSIENNSKETFKVFLDFVTKVLQMSINNRSIDHFKEYILFPAYFYSSSYEKKKQNPTLSKLHEICSTSAALHLKSIIWFGIGSKVKQANSIDEKKVLNDFYYHGFNGFNRLLFLIIQNDDITQFKYAFNQFENISNISNNDTYQKQFELRRLRWDNAAGIHDEEIKNLAEETQVEEQFEKFRRHVIMGLRYWVIFLYSIKKLSKESTLFFLSKLEIPYLNSTDILKDILLIRNEISMSRGYMEWDNWDYMEREDMVAYNPPSPSAWMTFGFMVDLIRKGDFAVNQNDLSVKEISNFQFMHEDLFKISQRLSNSLDEWQELLKVNEEAELTKRIDKILAQSKSIKRQSIGAKEQAIANAKLSPDKITNFKTLIGDTWKREARIHKLFKAYENVELIENPQTKLKIIGQRTFFERAKMMFIDGDYHSHIYGVERMGGNIGRWEDDAFFNIALSADHNKVGGSSLVEVLELALLEFEKKAIVPNLILLASEYSYQDDQFLKNEHFVPKRLDSQEHHFEDVFFHLGTYKKIPVYTSFSILIDNRVLICNFTYSFKMLYKTNPEWYDNELKVEVTEISDETAVAKLNENPDKWRFTEDEIELTGDDALILIKTSIQIDIWTTIDFQVMDRESYVVGYINAEE